MNISSLLLNRSLVIDVKGILLFLKIILEIIQNYVLTFKFKFKSSVTRSCVVAFISVSCGRLDSKMAVV